MLAWVAFMTCQIPALSSCLVKQAPLQPVRSLNWAVTVDTESSWLPEMTPPSTWPSTLQPIQACRPNSLRQRSSTQQTGLGMMGPPTSHHPPSLKQLQSTITANAGWFLITILHGSFYTTQILEATMAARLWVMLFCRPRYLLILSPAATQTRSIRTAMVSSPSPFSEGLTLT